MFKASLISFVCTVGAVTMCSDIGATSVISKPNLRLLAAEAQKQSSKTSGAGRLLKAAARIIGNERNQISSEMMITGEAPGVSFSSNVSIETTIEMPNKLNSKITFVSPNGLVGKQYQVISNGTKTWIYNLSTNQYSVDTYQEFIDSKDSFMLGMISNIYLSLQEDARNNDSFTQLVNDMSESDLNGLIATKFDIDENLSANKKTIGDAQYDAYKIDNEIEDIEIKVLLHEQLNEIKYIFLAGKDSELDITLQEKIISQVSPLVVPKQTFVFSPPDGSEQVNETIRIDPF